MMKEIIKKKRTVAILSMYEKKIKTRANDCKYDATNVRIM